MVGWSLRRILIPCGECGGSLLWSFLGCVLLEMLIDRLPGGGVVGIDLWFVSVFGCGASAFWYYRPEIKSLPPTVCTLNGAHSGRQAV